MIDQARAEILAILKRYDLLGHIFLSDEGSCYPTFYSPSWLPLCLDDGVKIECSTDTLGVAESQRQFVNLINFTKNMDEYGQSVAILTEITTKALKQAELTPMQVN